MACAISSKFYLAIKIELIAAACLALLQLLSCFASNEKHLQGV